jgi:hypothetical protein
MSKDNINKYKLKEQYPTKLDLFIEDLDNNTKKEIENGSNSNR